MFFVMLLAVAPMTAAVPPNDRLVEQAVTTAFPSHDTDGDGKLSRTEFAAWMLSLQAHAHPDKRPNGPVARKWAASAFRQADRDGSATVTAAELTGFLRRERS